MLAETLTQDITGFVGPVLTVLVTATLGAIGWQVRRVVTRFDRAHQRIDMVEAEIQKLREAEAAVLAELKLMREQQRRQHEQNLALLQNRK